MRAAVNRGWRTVGTVLSYVVFGIASLGILLIAVPIIRALSSNGGEVQLRVQRAIRIGFASHSRLMQALGVISVDYHDAALIGDGTTRLVVANHPSLIDIVLLGSLMEQADCIVNSGWTANNFFMKGMIEAAGYLTNEGGPRIVEQCTERLNAGRSLVVFPEGTRSPVDGLGKFQRGAAHVALTSGVPITAVSIRCRPYLLGRDQHWYDIPPSKPHYDIRIAAKLEPAKYLESAGGSKVRAARHLTTDLQEIYAREYDRG